MFHRRRRALALVAGATLALAACSQDPIASKDSKSNTARDPQIQRQVEAAVARDTENQITSATGAYVDPDLGDKTTAECIPESTSKLSCTVQGSTQPGFGDNAVAAAAGPFSVEWEVLIDPDTGRFKAKPLSPLGGF